MNADPLTSFEGFDGLHLQKNIEVKIFKIFKEKINIVNKKILVDIDDSGIIVRFCQSISDKEKTTVRLYYI